MGERQYSKLRTEKLNFFNAANQSKCLTDDDRYVSHIIGNLKDGWKLKIIASLKNPDFARQLPLYFTVVSFI